MFVLAIHGVLFSKGACNVLCSTLAALPLVSNMLKEHKFFNILRCFNVNIVFLQELGLNWSALSHNQQ